MGSDYFAVLRQARRPWLDPDQLKREYQRLTFERHPDRTDDVDEGSDFAETTEAYRVLINPKLRLQHLLSLEAPVSDHSEVPAEIADVFMNTASLVNELDRLLQRRETTTAALARSMLATEIKAIQQRAGAALHDLDKLHADALDKLQQLDQRWDNDRAGTAPELGKLAQRFGYLDRWIEQLREKQFQLSTA